MDNKTPEQILSSAIVEGCSDILEYNRLVESRAWKGVLAAMKAYSAQERKKAFESALKLTGDGYNYEVPGNEPDNDKWVEELFTEFELKNPLC